MKVALLSHMVVPIAEPFIGGMESFLFRLAVGLTRAGIEVVCYACEGSFIPGVEMRTCGVPNSDLVYPKPIPELNGEQMINIRAREDTAIYRAIQDAQQDPEIAILHNNSGSGIPFYLTNLIDLPIINTIHYPGDIFSIIEALRFCKLTNTQPHVVAVSHSQAKLWEPHYPISDVVHNGLDLDQIPFSNSHDGSLAFIGRMHPDKGVEDAIEVAVRLGKQLHIYGAPLPSNVAYFEERIQPLLQAHENVIYHGSLDQQVLFERLQKSQALIFPLKGREAFGNVTVEAMAAGVPVIMYDRGPAREIIKHGLSGYLVTADNIDEMASTVVRTEQFDRLACSHYARTYFSIEDCVNKYLKLYRLVNSKIQSPLSVSVQS